jgi:amidase
LDHTIRNVTPFFQSTGILSARELAITDIEDATALLEKIHTGQWASTEVTLAFCKRAALAHHLVNCLMDVDFDGALSQSARLDAIFGETGKPVGPLHGLPISIKVPTSLAHSPQHQTLRSP